MTFSIKFSMKFSKTLKSLFVLAMIAIAVPFSTQAIEPSEVLQDPVLEARARVVGAGLRCVVCQNQSIDTSNSELAGDMRVLVRDRIVKGDSNQQVMDYMVDRYGDYVLLNPPFKMTTLVLWLGPLAIAIFGMFGVLMFYRRRDQTGAADEGLSHDERRRLKELMKDDNA